MMDPFRRLVAISSGRFSDGTAAPPLVATPDTGDVPLTFFQEMRWNRLRETPLDRYYLDGFAVRLTGSLNIAALEAALADVAGRHDTLRLGYRFDEPVATLLDDRRSELQHIDCASKSLDVRAMSVELVFSALDISREPVFRPYLLVLAEDDHILLLTYHSLALNRPAVELVLGDWAACYSARCAGTPVPPRRTQYKFSDFARWQRGWLVGAELERRIARWTERLRDTRPVRLPTDMPRPHTPHPARLAVHKTQLAEPLAIELVEYGRTRGTTFSILLASLAVVLHARTSAPDITLKLITQALHRATHGVAGVFLGLAIVRVPLESDPPLSTILDRATTALLDALEDQMIPWSTVPGSLVGEPDIIIDALAPGGRPATWTGLTANNFELDHHKELPGRFDLECFIWLRSAADQLLWFLYNADLFHDATIERLAFDQHRVLHAMIHRPDVRLSALVAELA